MTEKSFLLIVPQKNYELNLENVFWGIVCFSTSIGSLQILNPKFFWICILHPVLKEAAVLYLY